MDADDKHCGTCKHGNLYDLCGKCEDEYELRAKAATPTPAGVPDVWSKHEGGRGWQKDEQPNPQWVCARYDELLATGKHGHYETLMRVVKDACYRAHDLGMEDYKAANPPTAGVPDVVPVARVAEVHKSRYTLEWFNGPLPEGTPLYGPEALAALQSQLAEANKPPTGNAPCARLCEHTAFVIQHRRDTERIATLTAENERIATLHSEHQHERSIEIASLSALLEKAEAERDAARLTTKHEARRADLAEAERDALKMDAERMKWVFEHMEETIDLMESYMADDTVIVADLLEAIDAARGRE